MQTQVRLLQPFFAHARAHVIGLVRILHALVAVAKALLAQALRAGPTPALQRSKRTLTISYERLEMILLLVLAG